MQRCTQASAAAAISSSERVSALVWAQPVAGRAVPEAATAEEISAARRDRRMDMGTLR
ncbi:hypothetical protein D3C86_879580 [compost metagenome]